MQSTQFSRKQSVTLITTILEIVAPVFILALVGFIWVKLGFEYRIQFITRLAMTLSVPALMFTALMKTEVSISALSEVALAAFVSYALLTVAFVVLARLLRLDMATYLNPLIFGNTGNVGLPLALFAFGDEGLGYALAVFAVMIVGSFTFGIWLVSGGGSPLKVVKEPVVWATGLGVLFLSQGWQTPRFLTNSLEMIGQITIPLLLITLGVAIARLKPSGLGPAIWLAGAKTVLSAGIAWAAGLYFGLSGAAFGVLVLQVATPVAVTSYLLAEKYGADADAVAGLVVVSTVMSVLALPLLLAFVI
jgi:malate permease and related proteins